MGLAFGKLGIMLDQICVNEQQVCLAEIYSGECMKPWRVSAKPPGQSWCDNHATRN